MLFRGMRCVNTYSMVNYRNTLVRAKRVKIPGRIQIKDGHQKTKSRKHQTIRIRNLGFGYISAPHTYLQSREAVMCVREG
jgi:hypothetical protein